MFDLVFAAIIAIVFILLAAIAKKPVGLCAIIFLIPLARRSVHGYSLQVSIVAVAIVCYFIGRILTGRFNIGRLLSFPYKFHLSLLFACICMSLIIFNTNGVPSNIKLIGIPWFNICSYVTSTVTSFILCLLIYAEVDSKELWSRCVRAFLWSGIFIGIIYLITGIAQIHLPEVLSPQWVLKGDLSDQNIPFAISSRFRDVYFSGFIGMIENFGEYLFVLFAFAILLLLGKWRKKSDVILAACSILVSALLAFPTAVKAYPIMIMLFLVPLAIMGTKGKNRLFLLSTLVFAFVILISFQDIISNTFLFKRLSVLTGRYHSVENSLGIEGMATILGRTDIITYFWRIIETGGYWGIGPFVVYKIGDSTIPFHNLYFSLYLSFGAIGLIIYMTFFLRLIFRLWWIRNRDADWKSSVVALVFLMIVLLFEQLKVSAFRVPYGIFSYWLILGLAFSLDKQIILKEKLGSSG